MRENKKFVPKMGQRCFIADVAGDDLYRPLVFDDYGWDRKILNRGIICETPEEAIELAKKMLKVVE